MQNHEASLFAKPTPLNIKFAATASQWIDHPQRIAFRGDRRKPVVRSKKLNYPIVPEPANP